MKENKVLALYDFASKQEFIYRTSKIKEISGASQMLSDIYGKFVRLLNDKGINVKGYDPNGEYEAFTVKAFDTDDALDAQVLYEGGGNLMLLYSSKEKYKDANRIISQWLIRNCPSLFLISCCTAFTGDFEKDRKALYAENIRRKNCAPSANISCVTPISEVDPTTFLPVVHKESYPYQQSLSADRLAKQKCFKKDASDNLENLEGLAAVIYIDGNLMGEKLKKCSSSEYDEGVRKLRSFSKQVHKCFVEDPLSEITKMLKTSSTNGFRKVIGGGDEITIICDARIAWKLVSKYFEVLKSKTLLLESADGTFEESSCTSCAGIAVFHAKSPFNIAYDIAEAACESAKKKAHGFSDKDNNNFIDFYYCHSGITNDFETLRESEQAHATGRPYHFDEAELLFGTMTPVLQAAGRANVKALGSAAQNSFTEYLFETERINAYLPKGTLRLDGSQEEMKLIYDMAEFYDIWFAKEDKADEKDD